MSKKITVELSQEGIQKAISEIEQYRKRMYDKCDLFVRRLAETGLPVIDQKFSQADGDSNQNHFTRIEVVRYPGFSKATLFVEGQDILFIEFGAGIHYNVPAGSSPHPKGAEFGYTIGSYGKGHGAQDSWWYTDDNGTSHRSYGTRATMPMYHASLNIRRQIIAIAKEVFGT